MIKQLNMSVSPRLASDDTALKEIIAEKLNLTDCSELQHFDIVRRSIDARGRGVKINLAVVAYLGELPVKKNLSFHFNNVRSSPEVVIVGAGPAGLFAALRLIELGLCPLIVERGKDVSNRKYDIAAIHRNEGVNPDSNYGFGEGGAGTFSDGKLYTRSKKRGDISRILELLVFHGAQEEILIDAHPHIGTNELPRVIKNIRETILEAGGKIFFNERVTGFIRKDSKLVGVKTKSGNTYQGKAVILASGHSARDIYFLLMENGVQLEAKNFAVGVRVEHPQVLIDSMQYHRPNRGKYLPAASYSFTEQVHERGVYSFCMCPGGVVVPAATANDELVVNGMSPSHRGGKFANSGMVVEVRTGDLKQYAHLREMAGLKFQENLERKCFKMAGNTQLAPSQRLSDFIQNRNSSSLPSSSYRPGLTNSDLYRWMPEGIVKRLQAGFQKMNNKARGFLSEDAIVIGVESRTSSPVRILRDPETFQSINTEGLFPCGEGAGYAGGIVSSAIDGERCAEELVKMITASAF